MKYLNFTFLFLFIVLFSYCKKRNIEEEDPIDSISGRKIRYTVLIIPAENTVNKSSKAIIGATVSLTMNDSIYTEEINDKGFVVFSYLFAGNAAVKVECPGYTTANYVVDLTADPEYPDIYDSDNLRNVSTIISLFPIVGDSVATVSGMAFAELDLTTAGFETVVEPINIRATVCSDQLYNYIDHSASGAILDLAYENTINIDVLNNTGLYEIVVPSSANGLKICLNSDDFVYNQITLTTPQRQVYTFLQDTVTVYPASKKIKDIIFTY